MIDSPETGLRGPNAETRCDLAVAGSSSRYMVALLLLAGSRKAYSKFLDMTDSGSELLLRR